MNWLVKLPTLLLGLFMGFSTINPNSELNSHSTNFQQTIFQSGISPANFRYFHYRQEVEFDFIPQQNKQTHVIFSTKNNPQAQINALQKIVKLANIKEKTPVLVDLSSTHPYATLKDN